MDLVGSPGTPEVGGDKIIYSQTFKSAKFCSCIIKSGDETVLDSEVSLI